MEMFNICVNLTRVGSQMVQRQPGFCMLLILCNAGGGQQGGTGGEVILAKLITQSIKRALQRMHVTFMFFKRKGLESEIAETAVKVVEALS